MKLILLFLLSINTISIQGDVETAFNKKKKFPQVSDFPTPKPLGEINSLQLPIKRAGNLILIEIKADSIQGNFILDTGAPHLVLNKTYFREYYSFGSIVASGITGSAGEGKQIRLNKLDLGGIYFEDVDADVISLSHLENKKGIKILGLIGLNLFKYLELYINVQEGFIRIHKLHRGGERIEDKDMDSLIPSYSLPVEDEAGVLIISGVVNKKRLRWYLDTGAESCVLHSGVSKKIFEYVNILGSRKLSGAGGKQVDVLSGKLLNLEFEELKLPKFL